MRPIVQAGAEVLRDRASEIDPAQLGSPAFTALIDEMVDTMRKAPGVGLAAPQIGVPLRVFVVEDPEELMRDLGPEALAERERVPVPLRVFVNPEVTPVGEEKVTFFEGCLSVNGYAALVARYREVVVTALDEKGAPVRWQVRGWPARILQHEMDHLEGTLYVDRMIRRSFGTGPQLHARFGSKPIAEALAAFPEPKR